MPGVRTGDRVVVDGIAGRVFINPTPATLTGFQSRQQDLARERELLKRLRDLPAVTRDGIAIVLNANIELPRDVEGAMANGAAGVGLLRTEFLYMNRDDLPDEDEQYESLAEHRARAWRAARSPPAPSMSAATSWRPRSAAISRNAPIRRLGLRAIRLSLKRTELLETQLAADAAGRRPRPGAHPAADDLHRVGVPPGPRDPGPASPTS